MPGEDKEATSPNSITIQLRKSVIANGDEVKELTFREPTGGDIADIGNPVFIDSSSDGERRVAKFDAKIMSAMLARLAMVPPSTIRALHAQDWESAAYQVASFFLPI